MIEGLASKQQYYDKASVRVCVYASLFGGKNAMFGSILENRRKASNMTEQEFKKDPGYEHM